MFRQGPPAGTVRPHFRHIGRPGIYWWPMSDGNQRAYPRFALQVSATLKTADGRTISGNSRNMSEGGLCLETSEGLEIGTDVEVSITLVFDEDSASEPLALPARVVWSTPFADSFQIGTQFRPLSQQQKTYLGMFLRYQEQPALDEPDDSDDDPFAE